MRTITIVVTALATFMLWLNSVPACYGQNTCGGYGWAPTLVNFGIYYREANRIEAWRGEFRWSSNVFGQGEYFGTEYTRTETCTSACSDDVYDFRYHERKGITWDTNLPDPVEALREEFDPFNPLCQLLKCVADDRCDEEAEVRTENARNIRVGQNYYTWVEFIVKSSNNYFGMRFEAEAEQRRQECQLTCVHHTTPR